jgi:hypothetical protein
MVLFLGMNPLQLSAQLSDDFTDGNIMSTPPWQGDTEDFIVNKALQLQLNAESAGASVLCTNVQLPDSIRWEMYFELNFSPSNSNKLCAYLMLDTSDISIANGYYIEIGQNGTPDPILFFSIENGASFLLGASTIAFESAVILHLTILRQATGQWIFYADTGDGKINEILTLHDATFAPKYNTSFCIVCHYTSTRVDKFIIDNILITNLIPDKVPPQLLEINVIDSTHIEFIFNENIGLELNAENILITPGLSTPIALMTDHHTLHIALKNELTSGTTYLGSAINIPDTAQNLSQLQEITFKYIKISRPARGDVVINEVLFDPNTDDSPFIELYNTSLKYFQCDDLILEIEKDMVSTAMPQNCNHIIAPDSFVVFTNDRVSTLSNYPSHNSEAMREVNLPTLSRDFGSIVLRSKAGAVIDSVYYDDNFHNSLLDDSRGVSLERISPIFPALGPEDWNSASSQSAWGTPGLPNSQYTQLDSVITAYRIENSFFSPDGDGFEDFLLIRFADDVAGQLATARIYDEFGREVFTLMTNELLGSGSTGKWEGTTDMRDKVPSGIYILLVELLQDTGIVTTHKEAIILATGL